MLFFSSIYGFEWNFIYSILLQKEKMAEEHRLLPPQLCVNNCGFFGSNTTENLCSRCYRDLQLKEQQASSAKFVLNQSIAASSPAVVVFEPSSSLPDPVGPANVVVVEKPLQHNRCMTCKKRVGLTGFKCKCGRMLCGIHRYPEQHACEFDFKGLGKEQIEKANPVVKGEKLEKIWERLEGCYGNFVYWMIWVLGRVCGLLIGVVVVVGLVGGSLLFDGLVIIIVENYYI